MTGEQQREALFDQAGKAWQAAGEPGADQEVLTGLGDLPGFLSRYYRRVATEDLSEPDRLAAVARRHAETALRRPQGRAVIGVTELTAPDQDGAMPAGAGLDGPGLAGPRLAVDIVTDDMPHLVDSVTTELNRHRADVSVLLHPQLRVRRDVSGLLLGGNWPGGGTAGGGVAEEMPESWIHAEIGWPGDRASREELAADLRRVLEDVRVAAEDRAKMLDRALALAGALTGEKAADPEAGALLRWLAEEHFTFLGYREYDLVPDQDGAGPVSGVGLRPVPGTGLGILRHDRPGPRTVTPLPPEAQERALDAGDRLVLAKANSRSTVHRPNYLDYASVKKLGPDGTVTGEWRFLGLYSYTAHAESITEIPVLRGKVDQVLDTIGLEPDSHDGKDLIEILQAFPREELFEIPAGELTPIALGVLRLRERRQTRLFLRRDSYGRYVSCLVYLPRDRYTTRVRLRVQKLLLESLGGSALDYSAMVGDSALARLHVVVRGKRDRPLPVPDERHRADLERLVADAVRSWDEDLRDEAAAALGPRRADQLIEEFAEGVPDTYKADVSPADAITDLGLVSRLREDGAEFAVQLRAGQGGDQSRWALRVYRNGAPITLSQVLPQLQHFGLDVQDEHPYPFEVSGDQGVFWIYEFGLRPPDAVAAPEAGPEKAFEQAITELWHGLSEDDGFNALVLAAGLTSREVTLIRAIARYLRQAGMRYSEAYVQQVLLANPAITRLLVRQFESRFDPARAGGAEERCEAIAEELRGLLDEVSVLDHDRILRSYLALIEATLRTSYYQRSGADYLVLKLDPGKVPGLVAPRPKYEIFVYSPRFEAVHLRFGRVARGGLRWSDRPEDFRTEVLGLVKAQEVKNSVIVPSGAKGGFVCKRLPPVGSDGSGREAYQAEVLACYRSFISAMLDVTDNISGTEVVPPPDLVRRDGDDPYLVVAADKGTATFSDTANGVAARYGFWLGDAFASGGSEGYDHKAMGITAKGAWESVRCHFAALGIDPSRDVFTAAGIGDMSGDVFGNGMLLSSTMKLVAAFDHRHIFVDPDPDPASSFAERRRMFGLPRSSWDDYDRSLISAGGGIWPRSVKSVPVSARARSVLGLAEDVAALSPDELISAILRAPVDLLWNGGIGTYVRASSESNADAGDRSNDAVRVTGAQVRARVVGEGGNLGLTQAGRVEYALTGGLVNTDFIDNSAGVDTSDHEVNIKILLADAIGKGRLAAADRVPLLEEMTDEVAGLVLRHNQRQNMTLAAARSQNVSMLHVHTRYLAQLVQRGRLHQDLDRLPDSRALAERRSAGQGLVNPELSLLLAQTKIAAEEEVLASSLPDDPYLRRVLTEYFPAPLRDRFAALMSDHPLRREIITTAVINEMVDFSGTTSLFRLGEETGASVTDLTRAWLVVRDVFQIPAFWAAVERLGEEGSVDLDTRIALMLEGRKLAERTVRWLIHNRRPGFDVAATIGFFADGVRVVRSAVPEVLADSDLAGFTQRRQAFLDREVPAGLADLAAGMVPSYSAFDIVQIASDSGRGVEETAEVYFDLAEQLRLTGLRDQITALPREDRWSTMARSALRDDLYAAHAAITSDVLTSTAAPATGSAPAASEPGVSGELTDPERRLAEWVARNEGAVARAEQTLGEIWQSERFTFTTLSVALRAIRTLVSASALPQ